MPWCGQCGVEVDPHVTHCPLCAAAVQPERPELVAPWPSKPELPPVPRLSPAVVRLAVFESVSLLIFTAIVAVVCVDLFADGALGWSLRVLVALAGSWCLVSLVCFWYRSLTLMHTGIVAVTGIMLALLDYCDGSLDWFLQLSLPILALEFLIVAVLLQLRRFIYIGWANLTAFSLLGAGVFCVGLDLINDYHLDRPPVPTWSLTVALSLLPPVLFLTYVHYRLRKKVNLGKYFHV